MVSVSLANHEDIVLRVLLWLWSFFLCQERSLWKRKESIKDKQTLFSLTARILKSQSPAEPHIACVSPTTLNCLLFQWVYWMDRGTLGKQSWPSCLLGLDKYLGEVSCWPGSKRQLKWREILISKSCTSQQSVPDVKCKDNSNSSQMHKSIFSLLFHSSKLICYLISRDRMNIPIRKCHVVVPKASSHAFKRNRLSARWELLQSLDNSPLYRWNGSRWVLADGKSCRGRSNCFYGYKITWFLFLSSKRFD